MICQDLSKLLGFDCSSLTEIGDVAFLSTPFKFDDGDAIPVFVETTHGQVRFFDDGGALMHFIGRGIRIENRKQATFLINAAARNGAFFSDAGEIEAWASLDKASEAFAKYLASMLDLASWEREQRGVNTDTSFFIEEVALALRAWKPGADITVGAPFSGVSGRSYKLDFLVDGKAVIATGAHPNSVSSVLHKLVDIHGLLLNADKQFLVIIDDRNDPEAAEKESKVVQSVASTMKFTDLEFQAYGLVATH
jgi:hypothetical protein